MTPKVISKLKIRQNGTLSNNIQPTWFYYQIIYSLPGFLYITHTGKCLETLICLSRTLGKKSLNFGLMPENINKKYCINHVIKG